VETPRWWGLALLACGLVGFVAASRVQAAEPKDDVLEAEMLRDLDLLRETNMAQQGEFFQRMGVLEQLRLLESLRFLEGSPAQGPTMKEER